MIWRNFLAFLLMLLLWNWSAPAYAQAAKYAPPPSYSNAELRKQDFSGQELRSAEFSNANLDQANFSRVNAQGGVFSASVMTDTDLHGANLSSAMLDQVKFKNTNLSDAVLADAIMLRSTFENVNINGTDFSNAILDKAQIRVLCETAEGVNSSTGVETRDSLGCR